MSPRGGAIEALARAYESAPSGLGSDEAWDWFREHEPAEWAMMLAQASAAFDAVLDDLAVHTEEWEIAIHDAAETAREGGDEIDYLQAALAALRDRVGVGGD